MPPSTSGSLKQQPTSSRREQQLLSSLSFYGAYHFEFWNRVVHCIFVPAIWWCARGLCPDAVRGCRLRSKSACTG